MKSCLPVLLVAAYLLVASAPLVNGVNIDPADEKALLALKEAFGSNVSVLAFWGEKTDCSYWIGVTCNAVGKVIALQLPSAGLPGKIAPEIGNLTLLANLNLTGNAIGEAIPGELGKLTSLVYIDLSLNMFSGDLPSTLGACTNLLTLNVSGNLLGSVNFTDLQKLPKLAVLDLTNNNLGGDLPASFSGFTSLLFLSLNANYYSVPLPTGFFKLSTLQHLDLGANYFTGDLTTVSFAPLTQLTYLSLATNKLSGSVPDSVGAMTSLQTLSLGSNSLNGTISTSITQLTKLQTLDLSYNALIGTIPAGLGSLTSLTKVDLSYNNLAGGIPSFAAAVNLQSLALNNNNLTGTIPSNVWALKSCTYLSLANNLLTGGIPASLGSLSALDTLDLSTNQLTGAIPPELFGASGYPGMNLTSLTLTANLLTGGIPPSIGSQRDLDYMNLGQNALDGTIPDSIGNLTALTYFDVSANAMTGPVPDTIKSCTGLITLYLYSNKFSGAFPNVFNSLGVLSDLQIQENAFSSVIPPTIVNAENLLYLNMSNNQLSGSIPSGLFNLTNLIELDLHSNSLSGELAVVYSAASVNSLAFVDLHANSLTGPIPDALWAFVYLYVLDLSSNQLVGKLSSAVGGLSVLQYLSLENNFLGNCSTVSSTPCPTIPSQLGGCQSLFSLSLANNSFVGAIPGTLNSLPLLGSLDLSGNKFTGGFTSTGGLTYLDLSNNYLSSPIKVTDQAGRSCPSDGNAYFNFDGNCFPPTALTANCSTTVSRSSDDCFTFCNAGADGGACSGRGTCTPAAAGGFTCSCYSHYINDGTTGCIFQVPSLGLTPPSNLTRKPANTLFRYASSGFINSTQGKPVWSVATSWDWVPENVISAVSDQKGCAACWAFATASALESANYIVTAQYQKINTLSVQELVDCTSSASCGGGFPEDALSFLTTQKLVESWRNPYLDAKKSDKFCSPTGFVHGVKAVAYETVSFFGFYGLLLAVQQQPVIINIEANQTIFKTYKSGILADPAGISSGEEGACYYTGLDHTVLLVGYDLLHDPPYWKIKNSWGTSWGESGYARMTIKGGFGTCGMNVLPGLIPIVKGNDACNSVNYGLTVQGNTFPFAPGTMNPCGGGFCTTYKRTNKCDYCPPTFAPAKNSDGSTTCAPVNPCLFFVTNPCNVGLCVPGTPGIFSCVCPFGYKQVKRGSDNTPTCIVGSSVADNGQFIVPAEPSGLNCSIIADVFHILLADLASQNTDPAICGDGPYYNDTLAVGTVVNIRGSEPCALPYFTRKGDTCVSIIRQFNLAASPKDVSVSILSGSGSPNPNLECQDSNQVTITLNPRTLVCLELGDEPLAIPACSNPYAVKSNETCQTLVTRPEFGFSYKLFYQLNPGLNCDVLEASLAGDPSNSDASTSTVPAVDSPFTICLKSAIGFGATAAGCKGTDKTFSLTKEEAASCQATYKLHYDGGAPGFYSHNGYYCKEFDLSVGKTICAPH